MSWRPGESNRQVVVLMDDGCFSSTDIFLGAFAELPQVTLLGTASGGGSGRARSKRLAHGGVELRLSSMASFRPTSYDGVGIAPDVVVLPGPTDFVLGGTDAMLEAAIRQLKSR